MGENDPTGIYTESPGFVGGSNAQNSRPNICSIPRKLEILHKIAGVRPLMLFPGAYRADYSVAINNKAWAVSAREKLQPQWLNIRLDADAAANR